MNDLVEAVARCLCERFGNLKPDAMMIEQGGPTYPAFEYFRDDARATLAAIEGAGLKWACPSCHGTGQAGWSHGTQPPDCGICNGTGRVIMLAASKAGE